MRTTENNFPPFLFYSTLFSGHLGIMFSHPPFPLLSTNWKGSFYRCWYAIAGINDFVQNIFNGSEKNSFKRSLPRIRPKIACFQCALVLRFVSPTLTIITLSVVNRINPRSRIAHHALTSWYRLESSNAAMERPARLVLFQNVRKWWHESSY